LRIAVIADVHANLAALEAVLADIQSENISEIISLGDNIGYGPDPEEVLIELQKQKITSVMGNHEYALINNHYFSRLNPDPRKSLEITKPMLSLQSLAYSQNLEKVIIRHGVRLVHGCPPRSLTAYLYYPSMNMLEKIFASYPEKICFYGHTHTLNFFEQGRSPGQGMDVTLGTRKLHEECNYIINPGSVGQPRDRINNHSKYLIWDLEASIVTFKAVQYDVMRTVHRMRSLHLPSFNADRLLR